MENVETMMGRLVGRKLHKDYLMLYRNVYKNMMVEVSSYQEPTGRDGIDYLGVSRCYTWMRWIGLSLFIKGGLMIYLDRVQESNGIYSGDVV